MMLLTANGIAPTSENFKIAETGLLAQTAGAWALWSGRAATSLYHAFRLAMCRHPNIQTPEIIMPAVSCTTAANIAAMLGIQARFADIDESTALASLDSIQARYSPNTIAVVAIHLYGNAMPLDAVAQWTKEMNLLLIEDITQSLSGKYPNGDFLGSKGDVTVCSFNKTKIIEIGNGILIAKTGDTAKELQDLLAEEATPFPNISDEARSAIALEYRNKHHAWARELRENPESIASVSKSFLEMRPRLEPLYLRPVNHKLDMNTAWQALPAALEHRLKLAQQYANALSPFPQNWTILEGYKQSAVSWRFTLTLSNPEIVVSLSEAVRQDGFHVSNLYWAVNQYFNPDDACPRADSFVRRVMNLWLDSSVDEDYVQRCCASLLHHVGNLGA